MPGNPDIGQLASVGGHAKARRRLTPERVEAELGALDTLEDAMRWLRQIALWAAGGLLHGAVASACNRSVEVWVRAHESRLTREVVDTLRGRLEELEAQLSRQRLGRVP
jgi:hypothetical protein